MLIKISVRLLILNILLVAFLIKVNISYDRRQKNKYFFVNKSEFIQRTKRRK